MLYKQRILDELADNVKTLNEILSDIGQPEQNAKTIFTSINNLNESLTQTKVLVGRENNKAMKSQNAVDDMLQRNLDVLSSSIRGMTKRAISPSTLIDRTRQMISDLILIRNTIMAEN